MLARLIPAAPALARSTALAAAVVTLGVLGTLVACATAAPHAHAAAPPADQRDTTASGRYTSVRVTNRHWLDVVVYVVRSGSGQRCRLGTVVAAGSSVFRVPADLLDPVGELALYAHPVGMATAFAERVLVHPGERVEWTLESAVANSSIFVR